MSALLAAVRPLGVTSVEVDHDWGLRQEPRWARGEKPLNPFQEMDYPFYPIMLRWTLRDGSRRLAWLEPEIDGTRKRPRLDHHSMLQRFADMIAADARNTLRCATLTASPSPLSC